MSRSTQLLLLASLFSWSVAAWANSDNRELIRVISGTPEGFHALSGKQTTQADIYYGGVLLTSTFVEFDHFQVEVLNPREVIEAIPNVAEPEKLISLLSGPRPSNAEHLCHRRANPDKCGRLQPEVMDTLWDSGRFRLDLFVGRNELLVHELEIEKYLPESTIDQSVLHNVTVNVSGTGKQGRRYIGSESFVAFGESRLRGLYAVTDDGFSLNELTWQRDEKDTEYEFGSFRTLGSNSAFASDLDVVGFRIASSTKRRVDLDKTLGSSVLLFLPERSRVDVYRGRQLIHTRYYEAGNQEIDSSGFPDGAYEISLRVTGLSGAETETTQFYARSAVMPPKGEPQYFVEGGTIVDTYSHSALPRFISEMWVRAGASYRLRDNSSVDGEFIFAGGKSVLQAGLFTMGDRWRAYTGLLVSNRGDSGLSLRGTLDLENVQAQIDMRTVRAKPGRPHEFDLFAESYTQGTASLSFRLGEGRLLLRGQYNERRSTAEKNIGFSYWAPSIKLGPLVALLSLDGNYSSDRSWIQAGVQLRWQGKKERANFNPRLRYSNELDNSLGFLANGNWNGFTQLPYLGETERAVVLQHDDDRSTLGARFLPKELPMMDLEFGLQRNQRRADFYYAMNNQFTVVSSKGKTTLGDGGNQAGAVMINVEGTNRGKFEVMVDGRVVGHVWGGRSNVISLRPYQSYQVEIKPVGVQFIGFEQRVHTVTLYPGNVETLIFSVRELTVLVGQLNHPDGVPVANGQFQNVEGFGGTDAIGWFQVEVSSREPLRVGLPSGEICEVTLPDYYVENGLAMLDSVVCEPIQAIQ